MTKREERVRIIMLGDSGVGKSAIINRFTKDLFSPTFNAEVAFNRIEIDNQPCKLQIYDDLDREILRIGHPIHLRMAEAAMILFDMSRQVTLDSFPEWIKNVERFARKDIVLFLVGTKVDLVPDPSDMIHIVEEYAKEKNATCTFTSAKDNIGIENTFVQIVQRVRERRVFAGYSEEPSDQDETFNLTKDKQKRKSHC